MQAAQSKKFRVLIGDASVRARMVLSGMFNAEPNLEVVDTAQTKEELLYKSVAGKPDIIISNAKLVRGGILPLYTSVYGEVDSLELLLSQEMVSKTNPLNRKFQNTLAIRSYAFDTIAVFKSAAFRILVKLKEFLQKCYPVKNAFALTLDNSSRFISCTGEANTPSSLTSAGYPLSIITIGASTGGSTALEYLIKGIDINKPTVILVAVHMPGKFTKRLAHRLQKLTDWNVQEATPGMLLRDKMVVIAPGGFNTLVRKNPFGSGQLFVDLELSSGYDTPCIDSLFQSAAFCAKEQVLGVIMTGMGNDGTVGALEIKNMGGMVIAQDKETSSIFGMAKSAIESGAVQGVFALDQLTSVMNRFVMNRNMGSMLQTSGVG